MRIRVFLCLLLAFSVLVVAGADAAPGMGCLTGDCHQQLTATEYVHGPVAAEMAGVKACEMCHVPTAVKCSSRRGGKFSYKSKELCTICHNKGTGSQHSEEEIEVKCLKCHDPHGSETSRYMLRQGGK
ncbi:MAG: cytochrome c3 family protein [Thermodesulfobacteriota bacterium]